MLFSEPPATQGDLHFSLLGIRVRVHPMFWLFTVLLGIRGTEGEPLRLLVWVAAVFISILVHEMGHALVIRSYGWRPWITLHAFGGLASYQPTHYRPQTQLLISAAGPAAGFLLAALVVAMLKATGNPVGFIFDPKSLLVMIAFLPIAQFLQNPHVSAFVFFLLYINVYWGLINLLPIYPLDGGQICRSLLELAHRRDSLRLSLWISVITSAGLAVYVLVQREDYFLTAFFAYLAYTSYMTLEGYMGRGGWR
jgi:Zn-dependent protease